MDNGDKMIFAAVAIVLILSVVGTVFCKYFMGIEGAVANPGEIKQIWTYNSNLNKEYSPDNVLAVITAANNLAATRAPLLDMAVDAGTQLRDGFVGGYVVEGMPYQPNGSGFRESYSRQFNKLMTEEDQVYYLGRGMSPLYNADSPFYPHTNPAVPVMPTNPAKPMMPTSATSLRAMHTTENATSI